MKAQKRQGIVLFTVVLLILATLVVCSFLKERIPKNPVGTIGNTAGNLNNKGLFCEHNGTVYFSNAKEYGDLYAMNPDETDVRKLSELNVCNILAGEKHLYYFQLGDTGQSGFGNVISVKSFNRSDLKGGHVKCLTRDIVVKGQLVDDWLYLLTTENSKTSFYKMKTDKSDITPLANYEINPACARNGIIYYNGTKTNHYLYGLDTETDIPSEIWQGNIWYPALDGEYIYYMDVAENYRLCRYSLTQNFVEVLTNERIECFNVGNGYIYYQTNGDAPQLKCMRTDGSDAKMIAEGSFTNINMTSQYVYFQKYGIESSLYHSYIGSDSYEDFIVH